MTAAAFAGGGHAELGLDVDAEIEVLTHAPLQGSWQAPAEVVRWLLARRAREVDLELRRGRYLVRAGGAGVGSEDLERLAVVLDPGAESSLRHAALVELEATEAMPLLWATGAAGARWRLEVSAASGRTVVTGGGRRVRLVNLGAREGAPRGEHEIRIRGFDRRRAADWLRAVCRFATTPVRLDGDDLGVGHREGAFRARLRDPLPALVAIGTEGEAPTLWLLRHGIVAARATVPGFPPFHAAVELAEATAPGAAASEVRAAVQPFLSPLIEAAVRLMVRAATRLPELAEQPRRALTLALLRAAATGLCRQEVVELRLAPCGPPGRPARWMSLRELAIAERPPAAASERELDRLRLHGTQAAQVVRFGPEERELVRRLTGVRLVPPAAGVPAGLRGLVRRALRWPSAVRGWLGTLVSGSVPESGLEADEIALVAAIRRWSRPSTVAADGAAEVVFVDGRGRPWATGGRLRLPRRDPSVRAAVRALALGERWVYPALLSVVPAEWPIDDRLAGAFRISR